MLQNIYYYYSNYSKKHCVYISHMPNFFLQHSAEAIIYKLTKHSSTLKRKQIPQLQCFFFCFFFLYHLTLHLSHPPTLLLTPSVLFYLINKHNILLNTLFMPEATLIAACLLSHTAPVMLWWVVAFHCEWRWISAPEVI